jgi:hypothetical protein
MKLAVPCLALLLSAAAAPASPAADYSYMLSAGELRGVIDQGNKAMAVGYISGVMDAMMRTRDFCVPEARTRA